MVSAAAPLQTDYTALAAAKYVKQTAEAVKERGIHVEVVDAGAQALEKIKRLIPAGASVMTASSQTLQQIGLEELLIARKHPWVNLKDELLAEKDMAKQLELRKQSTLADYYLGSVHAIARTGEIVVASGTGSQLPSYIFTSPNVIWVAGVQKIVPTLEDGLRRVREYSLPREDERMKSMGRLGSAIGKLLIFEHEAPFLGRNVTLILVNERVGV